MSDQQKIAGLQMLQQRQAGMQQSGGMQQPSTAPGSLAAMEGRYVAPTGAGYQYYQGGSTAPPFNPAAFQTMLKDTMAKQALERSQRLASASDGLGGIGRLMAPFLINQG
jgi:hypothetical protein